MPELPREPLDEDGEAIIQSPCPVPVSETTAAGPPSQSMLVKLAKEVAKVLRPEPQASIGFGLRYLYGSGVERNHVRALMWFKLALAAEQPDADKYHDLVARFMTPLQIARAQAFAEICADSNYTECD